MKKLLFVFVMSALQGCTLITVDRRAPVPVLDASGTNMVATVDGGYEIHVRRYGMDTTIKGFAAKYGANGVEVTINELDSDLSAQHAEITASAGTAVGNVAEKVIEAVK